MLAIVGPTAAGKSALAMRIATKVRGEIVCVDSATVYRGMDIGTGKPAADDRAAVPHHLLDFLDPQQQLTVADFQRRGRAAVEEIRLAGDASLAATGTPLLVGGSGLYFRAIVDPLEFPGTDPAVRSRLGEELEKVGALELHRRLEELDPQAAGRIHPANARRTVRALEVLEHTGRRFSSFRTGWDPRVSIYPLKVAGLAPPLEVLDSRIDARVDRLIGQGWLEEVAGLAGRLSPTSARVLGYAQLLSHLSGTSSLEEAVVEIKRRTRKFARRQLRWFKADPRVHWFEEAARAEEYLTDDCD
ncbi:MAG: tRNA (adenosine(37)-N6)-dimethylallyltransferase MiaA [Actinomycetota bacterium]